MEFYKAKATGYIPIDTPMEGGEFDRMGNLLITLQEYLKGVTRHGDPAPYVSCATDRHAFPYGTVLFIPELWQRYGETIEFRVVDTGSHFKGLGTTAIDICTSNKSDSEDEAVNGELTLIVVKRP